MKKLQLWVFLLLLANTPTFAQIFPLYKGESSTQNRAKFSDDHLNKSEFTEEDLTWLYIIARDAYEVKDYQACLSRAVIILKHTQNEILTLETEKLLEKAMNAQNQFQENQVIITNLSGPRMGFLFVTGDSYDDLKNNTDVSYPLLSMFGFQFEQKYFSQKEGFSGIIEFIPAIIGVDQGVWLPSFSLLIGVRTPGAWEWALGPNAVGTFEWADNYSFHTGMTIAFGKNIQSGGLNIPLNVALVYGKYSTRLSVTFGFNTQSLNQ